MNLSNHPRPDQAPGRHRRERLTATLRAHAGALAVGAIFLLLSAFYSVAIPAWEADNELSHFNYVRYLVDRRTLPPADAQVAAPVMADLCRSGEERILAELTHQFRQPPLYYLLGALSTGWIPVDAAGPAAANPFRTWDPSQLGYNFALHNLAQEGPPYADALLALHALRLMSGLLGLLGLVATYLLGLLLFGGRRPLALAMMAINAFIPQYLFASAIVNNDILIAALSAWCLYWCALVMLRAPRLRTLALAGLTAALAILAKYNGVVLLAPVALATLALLRAAWHQPGRQRAAALLRIVLLIAIISVPTVLWLLRNQTLYGQWLGSFATSSGYLSALLGDLSARSAGDFLQASLYAFATFWGQFGWDTLTLPGPILALLAGVSLATMLGIALILLDRRQAAAMRWTVLAALVFTLLVVLQAFIRAGNSLEPRGRYLFPALATFCFLQVAGWQRLLPARYQLTGVRALWIGFLALALATPFMVLRPAYAPPRLTSSAELLPGEQPINAVIGDFAELVAYRVEPQRLTAGEPVEVTLVWRALQATPNNYTLSIHLLDGDTFPRAWVMSHPGHGNYPTSAWQPGAVFRESYTLYWAETPWEKLPSRATFKVALGCPGSPTVEETYLGVVDAQGVALGDAVYFGRIKVVGADEPPGVADGGVAGSAAFGDELALESLEISPEILAPGGAAAIELRLRALRQPGADYTVFTHIVDEQGQQVGGNDQPLTDGYYPSGLWEAGETISHTQHVTLPPFPPDSRYEIHMGLYDPVSGQRLPLLDPAGQRLPDDRLIVTVIETPSYRVFFPMVEVGHEHAQ